MKTRIWLLSLIIVLVCVILFGIAATEVYYELSIDDGKNYIKVFMNEFDPQKYPLTEDGAKAFSEKLSGARVTFMDESGKVIADSLATNVMNDHSGRKEIKEAIESGEGFSVRSSETLSQNMLYYCKSFDGEYIVRIALFVDSDWKIFLSVIPTILPFMALTVFLCIIIAVVATEYMINPVKKLAKDASDNEYVDTEIQELKPVAAILNAKNRSIKRQMEELKKDNELVLKAQTSKDEFISNVTHEMNTPLTSIKGYSELLTSGLMSEEQKEIAYQTIATQSERLSNLIACIINYSEIDSDDLPKNIVDVSALLKEAIFALKPEADKNNLTIVENIKEDVTLLNRHEYISEIIGNLLRNAIKYNKVGGSIFVTLDNQKLEVKDTGVGISEENYDKIFDRFFTVDKSRGGKNGGFGLGLAVVKKICKKSGFGITVESELEKGSTFTITFDDCDN